jgi:flagellin
MSLTIDSTSNSLYAQNAQTRSQQAVNQVLAELASGSSINSAADNPAGLAISESFTSQINGDQQALTNAISGGSLTQTVSGALSQLQDNTQQIQQLAVEAGDGALNSNDRQALQAEVDQLTQANSQIVQSTQFNGMPLLSGNTSITLQVGVNGATSDQVTVDTGGLDNSPANGGLNTYNANLSATGTIDVTTQANATAAQGLLAQDLNTLNNAQASIGGASNRLSALVDTLQGSSISAQDARSRISDTDYAAASAALAQDQIQSNASLAALGQANVSQSAALTLLR